MGPHMAASPAWQVGAAAPFKSTSCLSPSSLQCLLCHSSVGPCSGFASSSSCHRFCPCWGLGSKKPEESPWRQHILWSIVLSLIRVLVVSLVVVVALIARLGAFLMRPGRQHPTIFRQNLFSTDGISRLEKKKKKKKKKVLSLIPLL